MTDPLEPESPEQVRHNLRARVTELEEKLRVLKDAARVFMTWMHETSNPSFEQVYRMAAGVDNALAQVKDRGERW
jgi:hypothetical protein